MSMDQSLLAIHGGVPVRKNSPPPRRAVGPAEREALNNMFETYWSLGQDPGYQGLYEEKYCRAFVEYMGVNGYADAVATGTAAVLVALCALNLPKNSTILTSPITDPGTVNAVINAGHRIKLVDSMPGSYNTGLDQVQARVDSSVKAFILVHAAGQAAPVDEISKYCASKGIKLIEDCSQSHGAEINGIKVGTFGDISVFSTMYRKSHCTGGCGGLVFTKSKKLYDNIRSWADRGKPFDNPNSDLKNPDQFHFPALNLNQNEIACAIGLSSLSRLDHVRKARLEYLKYLLDNWCNYSKACQMMPFSDSDSPFVHPVFLDTTKVSCSKKTFALALSAEGININPHYPFLVNNWSYVKPWLVDDFNCPNAIQVINETFTLLFHEGYGKREADETLQAIRKIEKYYIP